MEGQLGYASEQDIGDDEQPVDSGFVSVGANVTQISTGNGHTCAVTDDNKVKCWGNGHSGKLGYASQNDIGDNEHPADSGDVNVGLDAVQIATGESHTCALTVNGTVRCWGLPGDGRLGYGNSNQIGDDEYPADAGDVIILETQLPVELNRFDVTVNRNRATLFWATATETDNAGFEIVRFFKRGNQSFWDVVGFVRGAGTTQEIREYTFEVSDLEVGRHRFRLRQIDFDGTFEFSSEVEAVVAIPGTHFLGEAYPNPFNPRSYFSVAVPVEQRVTVTVHDLSGRLVETVFEGNLPANELRWFTIDGTGLASGLYLYRLTGPSFSETRSVTLLK
jgi:alpha-tubulin suppressor-like RCC1 family protein